MIVKMSETMSIETVYGTTNEESHVMSEKVQTLAGTVYKEFEKVIKRYDEDVVKDLMPLVVGILETLDAAFTEKQELDVEIELLREDNEQLLTQYEREKQLRKTAEQKFLEMEDNIEGVRKELEDKVETLESILRMSEIKSKNSADHVSRLEEKEQEGKNEYNKLHERYTELFRTHMDYMERTKILMGTDKLSDLTGMSPRITKGGFNLPGLRPVSVAYGGVMEFQRHESSPMSFDTGTPLSSHSVSLKSELDAQTPKKAELNDEKEQQNDSVNVSEKATTTKQPNAQPTPNQSETKPSKTKSKETRVPGESGVGTNSSSQKVETAGPTPEESNVEASPTVVLRKKKENSEEDYTFDNNLSFEDYSLSGLNQTLAAIIATTPELEESQDLLGSPGSLCKRKSVRNDNSIFDELQSTDIAEVDFGADITDSDKEDEEEAEENKENDRDSVGDNFFGMGKELDNLIMENTELLATKNALNIVKDDLIAKVDELSSEQEILREEIASLQAVRTKLQQRLTAMEEELKRVREENEKRDKELTEKGEEEEDVPMAQRKRFTRMEMARVLMERNQYKEKLMELQEAVRWTEMIRASRGHPGELQPKKKTSVWNFFSELVAPSQAGQAPSTPAYKQTAERHQNVLQAVITPSHHHLQSPSESDIPSPATSVSLLPSPTARSLSSLAQVTILPPHEVSALLASEPAPVPVVLPSSLLNLPPTPSGDSPLTILPVPLPLSTNPTTHTPTPTTLPNPATLPTASAANSTVSASSAVNPITTNQPPLVPKAAHFHHRPVSALPGIQLEPDHQVQHFFSNLFSGSNKPKRQLQVTTVKYSAPTTNVQPVGDPNKKHREKSANPKSKAYDFLQEDLTSEKAKKERERERREQYKQVRAHVKKDDGRVQAYGWSLPAKFTSHAPKEMSSKSQVPVPVPVYCRPLFDGQMGWKVWCAAGVNLTGGRTRDGGSIVGASVFYSDPPPEEKKDGEIKSEVEKLDKELKDHEKRVKDAEKEQMSSLVWVCTSTNEANRVSVIDANNPADVLDTFRVSVSHILCIASIPGAMESDYPVAEEILNAEAPVLPKETVVTTGSSPNSSGDSSGLGGVTFVQCATGGTSPATGSSPVGSLGEIRCSSNTLAESTLVVFYDMPAEDISIRVEDSDSLQERGGGEGKREDGEGTDPLGVDEIPLPQVFRAKGSPASSVSTTPTHTARLGASGSTTDLTTDGRSTPLGDNEFQNEEAEKMSSVLPTMWLGTQSGSMYVHSSISNWKRCLHSVKLRDSILGIVHVKGRALVSLADGTVAIFHRAADGQWDLLNYHLIDLGRPKQSIRCMTVVAGKHVWCGYNNKVHIINPQTMAIEDIFDVHPRKESQVRQLCWLGDGVWVSIRLDSTLRLYHAYTHHHLQDVDIEPYVSKMLGAGKLGFSFVRITAMLISCNRLWIGTGNGVIISVPLSESNKQPMITSSTGVGGSSTGGGRPGGVIRVYSDAKTDSVTPGTFIPYCSMAQAQLSFHGHKDAVKFFVSVPAPQKRFGEPTVSELFLEEARRRKSPLFEEGVQRQGLSAASDLALPSSTPPPKGEATPAPPSNTKLVLSGGEGYVDFRLGDGVEEDSTAPPILNEDDDDPAKVTSLMKADRSHIIVWQVTTSQD